MSRIYYRQIKSGKMELDDVPEYWREQVKALLDADAAEEAEPHDLG